MLGGAGWNLLRIPIIALLVARFLPDDALFHIGLIWIGAPGLVIVGLFAGSALVEETSRLYLPLLRIGMLLSAVTDAIVVLTRAYLPASERVMATGGSLSRAIFVIAYGVLAVDLLILAALISYRPMSSDRADSSSNEEDS